MMSRTIDLELTRAEVEVRELEARLRVVPMNDNQLSDALRTALAAKKERLEKLRALHAAGSKPKPQRPEFDRSDGAGDADSSPSRKIPVHAGHRTPLKRTIPQRAKAGSPSAKSKTRK
jgi:hypothetical protein